MNNTDCVGCGCAPAPARVVDRFMGRPAVLCGVCNRVALTPPESLPWSPEPIYPEFRCGACGSGIEKPGWCEACLESLTRSVVPVECPGCFGDGVVWDRPKCVECGGARVKWVPWTEREAALAP